MIPCFVIGPGKSGTTLMISLLDNHPELAVIPLEVKFYAHYYSTLKANVDYRTLNDFFLDQSKLQMISEDGVTTRDSMNTGYVNFSNVDFEVLEKEMQKCSSRSHEDENHNCSVISTYLVDLHKAYTRALGSGKKKGFAILKISQTTQ